MKKEYKIFTHNEFKSLSRVQIDEMMQDEVAFIVSTAVELFGGYKYCLHTQTLTDKENKVIELTKIQNSLMLFLCSNAGKIVSYDDIREAVWRGKDMSVYTLRNMINKIRIATCYGIVENKNSIGYLIGESR